MFPGPQRRTPLWMFESEGGSKLQRTDGGRTDGCHEISSQYRKATSQQALEALYAFKAEMPFKKNSPLNV